MKITFWFFLYCIDKKNFKCDGQHLTRYKM